MFNYFDTTDEALRQGARNTYNYAKANFARLGITDPAPVLREPVDNYDEALTAAQSTDHRRSDVLLKNRTKKTLKEKLGAWGEEFIFHNHNLTDADIVAFDLHQRKPNSTIYPPDFPPVILVSTAVSRQLTFGYYVLPGPHQRMGKPAGTKACVLRWLMSETEPTHISQFVNVEYGTDGPIVLHFDESDRGKKVWFVASWQIERGRLEGPMTAIMCVVIP
jgi:hypothetical protein